jgi:hypothetical protein
MRLNQEDIMEFKEIYAEEFGEQISYAEAERMASDLMQLFELLARPLPGERTPTLEPEAPSAVGLDQRSTL